MGTCLVVTLDATVVNIAPAGAQHGLGFSDGSRPRTTGSPTTGHRTAPHRTAAQRTLRDS